MKKRIIAIIAAIAVITGGAVVAFNDVETGTILDSAVEQMASFNIINGYDDGSFRPENNITRAEFAKIIIETIMTEEKTDGNEAKFSDVAESHWAKDYIYLSRKLGIVDGVTTDIFKPENNITYEQAIKMIVAALGYENKAQQLGGYPQGYISVAQELGITKGIEYADKDFAMRGSIVLMLNNALYIQYYVINTGTDGLNVSLSDMTLYERHSMADKTEVPVEPVGDNSSDNAADTAGIATTPSPAEENESIEKLIEEGVLGRDENGVYDNADMIDENYADGEEPEESEEPLSTEHIDELTDETDITDYMFVPESEGDIG